MLVFEIPDESDSSLLQILPKAKRYYKKKIFHKLLREQYKDNLPTRFREQATQRQIDSIHLYLVASDITHMYRNSHAFEDYGDSLNQNFINGQIKAVKFRGSYYKFDPDLKIED